MISDRLTEQTLVSTVSLPSVNYNIISCISLLLKSRQKYPINLFYIYIIGVCVYEQINSCLSVRKQLIKTSPITVIDHVVQKRGCLCCSRSSVKGYSMCRTFHEPVRMTFIHIRHSADAPDLSASGGNKLCITVFSREQRVSDGSRCDPERSVSSLCGKMA